MNHPLFDVSATASGDGTIDEERREFERTLLQDSEAAGIVRDPLNKSEHAVRVVDRSRGGLCVLLESEDHPGIGSTVAVVLEGTARPAAVRWVLAKRDRGWRMGLQWLD
jgi:hypothetical protein